MEARIRLHQNIVERASLGNKRRAGTPDRVSPKQDLRMADSQIYGQEEQRKGLKRVRELGIERGPCMTTYRELLFCTAQISKLPPFSFPTPRPGLLPPQHHNPWPVSFLLPSINLAFSSLALNSPLIPFE